MRQKKTAILIICIGSSKTLADARKMITAAARQFPDVKLYAAVYKASQRLIADTKQPGAAASVSGQTGEIPVCDGLAQALDQAVAEGVRILAVQPLYLLYGIAYNGLMDTLKRYRRHFDAVAVGKPLLAGDADLTVTARALIGKMAAYDDGETAVCLMGHGTAAAANDVYAQMQKKFRESGHGNYYIGTLHAEPSLAAVRKALRAAGGYQKVALAPFMVFTGKHAWEDLAGVQPGSWKSVLEREGYQVSCVLEGLAQMPQVQNIYLDHLAAALDAARGQGSVLR